MYKINKEFHFSASHHLEGLPVEHPCTRLHGHNYIIIVECSSEELDQVGFVIDYRKLDIIKDWIDSNLDHRDLNGFMKEVNPTAENIAKKLFDIFIKFVPQITAIEVSETPKTNCRYEPTIN